MNLYLEYISKNRAFGVRKPWPYSKTNNREILEDIKGESNPNAVPVYRPNLHH
jgi:hypothetical protein